MLTQPQAVDYLLQRRILKPADIVRNGLIVEDVSSRHRNFTVRMADGAGYFLKQSDIRQARKTLHREAAWYDHLWIEAPDFASRHMPRLHSFDPTEGLLVLDHLDSVRPLGAVPSTDSTLPGACAAELGRALARLHDSEPDGDPTLDAPVPWVYSVHEPGPELLAELSIAAIFLVKVVQGTPGFGDLLVDLRPPSEPPTRIHGDIRWDNCLVRSRPDVEDVEQLFIVDWELGGFGDPCWDVAGVFSEYLSSWTRSMPLTPDLSLEESLDLSAAPLEAVRPSLAAFWSSYHRQGSDLGCRPAFLLRSIQLSGARLVQSAIESAQGSTRVTRTQVHMLQLAGNIVRDPKRAALQLLQLPIA